ncbi:MAG: signal peptidase I [Erythrobacter sp.]
MNEKIEDTNAPPTEVDLGENPPKITPKASAAVEEEEGESWLSFLWFLLKLALAVLIFRSFIFSPFSIPSESMLPRLWNGDYLIASKWSYGLSKHSLPGSVPLIPGRIFASEPDRGDVAIFKHPIDGSDYIKRVIALPGDSVELRSGQLVLNGVLVPKERIADFVIPVSPNTVCSRGSIREENESGDITCRYAQFRETLPSGVSYNVLDFGNQFEADNFGPRIVPQGRVFMMGDNRDNSQDSRFPAVAGGGIGFVPQDLLFAKAQVVMWSTDGSAEWAMPWTWFSAARWDRKADGI